MLHRSPQLDLRRTAAMRVVALSVCFAGGVVQGANFQDSYRWSSTVTDGGSLQQGNATTLRWSIIPANVTIDIANVPATGSNLVSYLDGIYGGTGSGGVGYSARPWFSILQSQFDMIASKTGLTFEYVADSGTAWNALPATGSQADIRLGGLNFPNPDELGRGALPAQGGDVVLDTWNNTFMNPAHLGGIFQHELGHALGLLHVSVPGNPVLMSQNITTQGPQFDDLYAMTRLYGDRFEKQGGNDTPATATLLGTLMPGVEVAVGNSTDDGIVLPHEFDFVTVDGTTDRDVYRVDIPFASKATFSLLPVGPTYSYDPSPLPQQTLVANAVDNLTFQVLASNGETPLATVDLRTAGVEERLDAFTLSEPGTYYVRVQGQANANQFYRLGVEAEELTIAPTRQLFLDRFDSTNGLNEGINDLSRQGTATLNSPYSFASATTPGGEPSIEIEGDKLVMRAVQGATGGADSPQATMLRNFGPEVVGERWLVSLDLHVTGSVANVDAGFALTLHDSWPVEASLSEAVDLNVILTTNNRYRVVEKGGNNPGDANRNNFITGPNYFVQMLVDETSRTPRVTVALNGTVVLTNESITMSTLERYFGMQLVTLDAFPSQQSVYAEVDNLSVTLLTDAITGDYNLDGLVNLADYTLWRDQLGMKVLPGTLADGNSNGTIDAADYTVWKNHFGTAASASVASIQVPEPASVVLVVLSLFVFCAANRSLRGRHAV